MVACLGLERGEHLRDRDVAHLEHVGAAGDIGVTDELADGYRSGLVRGGRAVAVVACVQDGGTRGRDGGSTHVMAKGTTR